VKPIPAYHLELAFSVGLTRLRQLLAEAQAAPGPDKARVAWLKALIRAVGRM
jgi:hypothetical protein